jgi:biopolymer transport protein ExbB
MDLADFFEQGGALMWAILLASVVGVAVFLERLWSLQRSRVLPRAFVDRIRGLVSKDKLSEAQILCEENGSSVAMLMVGALRAYAGGKERAQIKEAVEEVGNREVAHLDRNVEVVGTVASITPLMGLLGTVIGMIQVFQNFVESYMCEGTHGVGRSTRARSPARTSSSSILARSRARPGSCRSRRRHGRIATRWIWRVSTWSTP